MKLFLYRWFFRKFPFTHRLIHWVAKRECVYLLSQFHVATHRLKMADTTIRMNRMSGRAPTSEELMTREKAQKNFSVLLNEVNEWSLLLHPNDLMVIDARKARLMAYHHSDPLLPPDLGHDEPDPSEGEDE